jgi:DNA repair protein RadD
LKIDDLLSRADDKTLQELLGGSALRLVTLLDPRLASPITLQQLIIDLYTREGLLLSGTTREKLFDLLPSQAIISLAKTLNISRTNDYRSALSELKSQRFTKSSKRESALFNFFELVPPKEEEQQAIPTITPGKSNYPLFHHQRQASRRIKHLLYQGSRRVLLHMPTGSGKTRTAMNIIADHLRGNEPTVVIWLAFNEELCEQAASEFEMAWRNLGDREINIYRFWGHHSIDPSTISDGIVIAGLSKTFQAAKRSIEFISELGLRSSLVVIDEAHSAIAETYKLVLDVLVVHNPTTGLLGLSATPGRTWNSIDIDEQLSKFFSRKKVTLEIEGYSNPVDYLVSEKYLAKVEYRSLFYDGNLDLSKRDLLQIKDSLDLPDSVLKKLAEIDIRNIKIILEIEGLAKAHKRILVFATTVDHSDLLATILRSRGYLADSVTSRSSDFHRKNVIENFKDTSEEVKIICNYGVLTTGFDAPRTSAAVIARPTKSLVLYSQMIGRAIRGLKAGGNETAEIVTVIDQGLPGFGSVSDAFNNWEDIWE